MNDFDLYCVCCGEYCGEGEQLCPTCKTIYNYSDEKKERKNMYIDRLINSGFDVVISRQKNGNIHIYFKDMVIRRGAVLITEYGIGDTVEEAAKDYIRIITGAPLYEKNDFDGKVEYRFV